MKPVIFYVDDEPNNLIVFEASMPTDWEVKTFSNPKEALKALETISPWVIMSDQRMPSMNGVKYLELAKEIHPHAVRIIVTGYSAEDLVVESVKKAQIFDYIKKPWDPDELEASLKRAIDFYRANQEARDLTKKLIAGESELKLAHLREIELRKELECWVPPFVLGALNEKKLNFPVKRDIVGLAFDIIGSTQTHSIVLEGRQLRSIIIQTFSEIVLKHGGWRESTSGDSAYAHFGLWNEKINPYESALSAAISFRLALSALSSANKITVECGISLHVAKQSLVDVHVIELINENEKVVQKSFDTTSIDIDLLHRMEKLVHSLPGTNIIMSGEFLGLLAVKPNDVVHLGSHKFQGNFSPVELNLLQSAKVTNNELILFKEKLVSGNTNSQKKVA